MELDLKDIRIKKDIIYLGTGDFDPLKNIYFIDNDYNILKIKNEEVSKLLSKRYKSRIIKVFLINKDKEKIKAAQNALDNYKKKYKGYARLYKSEQKANMEENTFDFNHLNNIDIDEDRQEKTSKINNNDKREINQKNNNMKVKDYSQYFNEMKKNKKVLSK